MAATTYPVIVNSQYTDWRQNPDFIEACRMTRRPGDPTSYSPPHPQGASATDVTTFKVGLAGWSENNLPAIMYQLWPCQAWKDFRDGPKPGPRRDAHGNIMYERYPRPGFQARKIRDFEILRGVDKISTEVPWWLIEILFRLDPRLRWEDLDMLMEYTGKRLVSQKDRNRKQGEIQRLFTNALNNHCSRGRAEWFMVSWREKSKSDKTNKKRDTVLAALSRAQINANSTVGSTPGSNGPGPNVPLPAPRRRVNRPRPTVSQPGVSQPGVSQPGVNQLGVSQPGVSQPSTFAGSKRKRSCAQPKMAQQPDADGDGSDLAANDVVQESSRQKRQRMTAVNCSVADQSEDSAGSRYELEKTSTSRQNKRKAVDDEDEPASAPSGMIPSSLLGTVLGTQLSRSVPDVQARKKRRTAKEASWYQALSESTTQQPVTDQAETSHPSTRRSRPRHVEGVQKQRAQRPHPHSTSSALDMFRPGPCSSEIDTVPAPASSFMYGANATIHQQPFSSPSGQQGTMHGNLGSSLPNDVTGYSMPPPAGPMYPHTEATNTFEHDMRMPFNMGLPPSTIHATNYADLDASFFDDQQGYYGASTQAEQTQPSSLDVNDPMNASMAASAQDFLDNYADPAALDQFDLGWVYQ